MSQNVLEETIQAENPMKEWLVQYVGTKYNPDNKEVNVQMIVNAMADEFPEFVLALAQENFVRGYQQALYDVDYGHLKKDEEKPIEYT
jgi:uncharacterized protein YukJ